MDPRSSALLKAFPGNLHKLELIGAAIIRTRDSPFRERKLIPQEMLLLFSQTKSPRFYHHGLRRVSGRIILEESYQALRHSIPQSVVTLLMR